MCEQLRVWILHARAWAQALERRIVNGLYCALSAIRRHHCQVHIEVVVADRKERRAVKRELYRGVRRLQEVLAVPFPADLVVIVQRIMIGQPHLAGCYQLGKRRNGDQFAVLRIALTAGGKNFAVDEALAVLVEQCVSLANLENGASTLIPIEFDAAHPVPGHRSSVFPTDPLNPHSHETRPWRS